MSLPRYKITMLALSLGVASAFVGCSSNPSKKEVVEKVIRLVDRNEYKRRQGAIGPRISSRAFSRERRYPIVNGWAPGA